MISTYRAALAEGNFSALHEIYSHGVVLHLPGFDVHSRDLAIAHDLECYSDRCPAVVHGVWDGGPSRLGFTTESGRRRFATEWRMWDGRVVEIWKAEARTDRETPLPEARLAPPFEIAGTFGQLAPAAEIEGSPAVRQLHAVWNRRDLRCLPLDTPLRGQTLEVLTRFARLTAVLESELTTANDALVRWRLQAGGAGAIADLFVFSVWRDGVWTANYLDWATLESQLAKPAFAYLAEERFA